MAAFSCNTVGLPKLTPTRFRSSQHDKFSFPCNFSPNPPTPLLKTASLLMKVNEVNQDHVLAEETPASPTPENPPLIMSPTEQILRLAKSTVERPVEFALEVIAGPSISQAPLRLLVAALAAAAFIPGDSWEGWATKVVVSGGLVTMSACLLVFRAVFCQK